MLEITGLDEFERKLKTLADGAKKLDGQHNVPITELLTPSFLSKHTSVHSAQELFEKSGFKIDGVDDFKKIPDEKWDSYIRSISQFENWQDMLSEATKDWVGKQLGF